MWIVVHMTNKIKIERTISPIGIMCIVLIMDHMYKSENVKSELDKL